MVISDMQRSADVLYHRVVVYVEIVFSLRPFTCKDLLQYFRKCKQVFFLLLVIVMDSIKSNLSVNFVEGIQKFSAISRHHDSQIIISNYRFSVPR